MGKVLDMKKWSRNAVLPVAMGAVLLALGGCGTGKGDNSANSGSSGSPSGMGGGGPGGGDGGGGSGLKQAMSKIGKGPQALDNALKAELEVDPPAWDTIQPQTKEYAQVAGSLGRFDAPKGSKESWDKECAAFAKAASDLDSAAQKKDRDAARAAMGKLHDSCNSCHREHRQMRPGGRG